MNHPILYISLLVASTFVVACKQEKKSALDLEVENKLPELESKAGQYDASMTVNLEKSHRAVLVQQNPDGSYQVLSIGEPRKGVLPYAIDRKDSRNASDFQVRWTNANGQLIGSYSIEHPLNLRSCEDGESKIQRSSINQFELLIPSNQSIQNIEISENGKLTANFNINRYIKK